MCSSASAPIRRRQGTRRCRGWRSPAPWRGGSGGGRWKVGDKVCALVNGGGYAEYAVAEDAVALPIPGGLDMVQAAARAGDLLHRVEQRIRARAARRRRMVPGARRHQRHRHDRDPARQGVRRQGDRHGRLGRQVQGLPRPRRRPGRQLQDARTSSRPSRMRPAARASMSRSTWWAATIPSATSWRLPRTAASCRSPRWAAPTSRSTSPA